MTNKAKQHIFFVDDEPNVRKVVCNTLRRLGQQVKSFACAADCLEQLRYQSCDLLISDVKMPEMDGMELLKECRRLYPGLPVLLITAYGDIPMAFRAGKSGAVDFIKKPFSRQALLSTVESILKRNAWADPLLGKLFTKTEKTVLRLTLAGKTIEEIANLLHRKERTIEDHRYHIYRKIGVHNLGGLFNWAIEMGIIDLPENEG